MRKRFESLLTIAALLLLGFAAPAIAEEATPEPENVTEAEAVSPQESTPMPIYGLQMWKDAETGELRSPTAKEAAQISTLIREMFGARKSVPRAITHKNGMVSVELDESMLEFTVMRKASDGSLEKECVDDPQEALEFIGLAANGPEEE